VNQSSRTVTVHVKYVSDYGDIIEPDGSIRYDEKFSLAPGREKSLSQTLPVIYDWNPKDTVVANETDTGIVFVDKATN